MRLLVVGISAIYGRNRRAIRVRDACLAKHVLKPQIILNHAPYHNETIKCIKSNYKA
jgi:hypothetical protein